MISNPKVKLSHFYVWITAAIFFSHSYGNHGVVPLGDDIKSITGAHTRIVWVSGQYDLIGYDNQKGQFRILTTPMQIYRPLFTFGGSRVVYSCMNSVYVTEFDRGIPRVLCSGLAADVRRDSSGIEWVYVTKGWANSQTAPVMRHQLDNPEASELVWDKTDIGYCWFSVSADGKMAGGDFPHDKCCIAQLPNGSLTQLGVGCCAQLAPDNSYRMMHLTGDHKHIAIYDYGSVTAKSMLLNVNSIDTEEAFWPKWASNDPRVIVYSGPYVNGVAQDGDAPNIFLGKFDSAFTIVEKWAQVTDGLNFFQMPDAWIDKNEIPSNQIRFSLSQDTVLFSIVKYGSQTSQFAQEQVVVSNLTAYTELSNVSLSGVASWLRVDIDSHDVNKQILTNSLRTDSIPGPGEYEATVLVSSKNAFPPIVPYLVILVVDSIQNISTIKILPADTTIHPRDSLHFTAQALDSSNRPLLHQPPVTWNLIGNGTLSQLGMFKADSLEGGPDTILAFSGKDTGRTTVSVKKIPPLVIKTPKSNDLFHVGDTMVIRWDTDSGTPVTSVIIYLSIDSGAFWSNPINFEGAIQRNAPNYGQYSWIVPQLLDGNDIVTNHAEIRIRDYMDGKLTGTSSCCFSIVAPATVKPHKPFQDSPIFRVTASGLRLTISNGTSYTVNVYSVNGIQLFKIQGSSGAARSYSLNKQPGVYLFEIKTNTMKIVKKVVLSK